MTAGTSVQSLDPATAVDQTSITLLANVMEGVYRLDEKTQPQPAIATDQPNVALFSAIKNAKEIASGNKPKIL